MCKKIKNKKRYGDEEHETISLYEINKTFDLGKVTNPEESFPK